jgi:hypothetical protein
MVVLFLSLWKPGFAHPTPPRDGTTPQPHPKIHNGVELVWAG